MAHPVLTLRCICICRFVVLNVKSLRTKYWIQFISNDGLVSGWLAGWFSFVMSGWAKLDIAIGEWWNRTATPCTVASPPNNIVLHNFPGFVDQERHSHRNGPLLGSNTCASAASDGHQKKKNTNR